MKISLKTIHIMGLGFALLNGFLCWLNLVTGKPLFAALSGTACIMGIWGARHLLEYWLTRFVMRRAVKRAIENLEWHEKQMARSQQHKRNDENE